MIIYCDVGNDGNTNNHTYICSVITDKHDKKYRDDLQDAVPDTTTTSFSTLLIMIYTVYRKVW